MLGTMCTHAELAAACAVQLVLAMKNDQPKKLLPINKETLRNITGGFGFPGPLGTSITLRTATVATQTMGTGPGEDTKLEA